MSASATEVSVTPYPVPQGTNTDQLDPNEYLTQGQQLTSENGQFIFVLQADSNIVLYQGSTPLWSSGTVGKGITQLIMQDDGNLVGYDSGNHSIWSSHTSGNDGAFLVLSNDGVASVLKPIWTTAKKS